jgi:hypothetical protein
MPKIKIIISEPEDWCLTSVHDQLLPNDWSLSVSYVANYKEYNQVFLAEPRASIYGFLSGKDQLRPGCLFAVIKAFSHPEVGVAYSDKYIDKNGNLLPQVYPPFQQDDSRTIFNPILFISGSIKSPVFDPNLPYLGSYNAIHRLGKYCRIIHIPRFLIVSKYVYVNIDEDLKRVWQQNS